MSIKKVNDSYEEYFYLLDEAKEIISNALGGYFNIEEFELYQKLQLFILITENDRQYMLKEDIDYCIKIMQMNLNISREEKVLFGYNENLFSARVKLSDATFLFFSKQFEKKPIPAFVRNLFYTNLLKNSGEKTEDIRQYDLLGLSLLSKDKHIQQYMEEVEKRKIQLDSIVKRDLFTSSTSYMGNKRKILGFLIESMMIHIDDRTTLIDLMCGSGVVSCAFSKLGITYASDAQDFCRLLAYIQGAGFPIDNARDILNKLLIDYEKNYQVLVKIFNRYLLKEDAFFHRDYSDVDEICYDYIQFCEEYPKYSSTISNYDEIENWINARKENKYKFPYCLFTTYFANVYFGVLQCIQLDSLRYAIDQMEQERDKDWALGVLVTVAYGIATGHSGHFAQPKKLNSTNILKVIEMRKRSAKFEFIKRFQRLGDECNDCTNNIKTIPGPWEVALNKILDENISPAIVYLDAPYKREEYSRYYHVLETLVKYDYPSSENKGRMRSKVRKERFDSEFFTKTTSKVEDYLVQIITEILENKYICAWSYSDNGAASIVNVISGVKQVVSCNVYIYGTYHKHKSQRKKTEKTKKMIEVIEYLMIFVRC